MFLSHPIYAVIVLVLLWARQNLFSVATRFWLALIQLQAAIVAWQGRCRQATLLGRIHLRRGGGGGGGGGHQHATDDAEAYWSAS